jgi:predicted metal-dependent hydrolase
VSAYRDGDTVVVQVPARLTPAEEAEWVSRMLARLERRESRRKPGEVELARRAAQLSARYLEDRAQPGSVRWVDNQQSRWGSCTVADRSIRLSTRLQGMPGWVVDYVLLHELAHLLVPGHDRRFWALLQRYERTERARGYLEGYSAATGQPTPDGAPEDA